jgi:WD40 repeat protein
MPRLLTLFVLPVLAVFAVALSAQERPSRIALVGGHLATATRSQLTLFDLSTGLPVARLEPAGYVATVEASPVEDVIAVGTCARSVELWNVKSRRRLHRLAIRRECVNSVSFSPDGALLAIADIGCCAGGKCPDGGSVQIWDVRSGTLKQELAKGVDIHGVVFGGDGRWLVAAACSGGGTGSFAKRLNGTWVCQ